MADKADDAQEELLIAYPVATDRLEDLVEIDDVLGLEPGTAFIAAVDLLKGILELRQDGYDELIARKGPLGPTKELQIDLG